MSKTDETHAVPEAQEEIPFGEIFSGPAVFANKTYVTVVPIGVRMTFVEVGEGQEYFRTAAYLTILDAIALRDVLHKQLENLGVSIKEMTKDEMDEYREKLAADAQEK